MKTIIPIKVKEENLKFYNITQGAYYFGFVGHLSAVFTFWYLQIIELTYFNALISVPSFLFAIINNRLGRHNLAFAFAFFELFVHQIVAVYYIGWESGWHYWLIYLAGLCFFNPHWSRKTHFKLLLLILSGIIFSRIFLYEGIYTIPEQTEKISYIANILATTLILSLLINYYSRLANKAELKLKHANSELSEKNIKIETQKEQIVQSITYAKRIQQAVMSNREILSNYFSDSFILFKPKDIVSGDFYWFSEIENKIVVICADCTGHGVPGALMSMLGMSYLDELVKQQKITQPKVVLEKMRAKIKLALGSTNAKLQPKDGMDMSICVFDKNHNVIKYAGANNGVFMVRSKELTEYKPTKNPVGLFIKEIPFEEVEIEIKPNDLVYLYTDGFIDQFGGKHGTKFMKKKLKEFLIGLNPVSLKEQKQMLQDVFSEWQGDYDQIDDCTLIGLKIS